MTSFFKEDWGAHFSFQLTFFRILGFGLVEAVSNVEETGVFVIPC